jgi:formate-dependent nitrite reductase membrane component NrfD
MTNAIHEWMVNYTRQTEWIDRRGLFLWVAFFSGTLGGGLYLASLYFNSFWGMFAGWAIVAVIKGGAHMMDLGKPWRAWRMVLRPGSSWMSRGLIFVFTFIGAGAVQLALTHWAAGSAAEITSKILAGMAAFGVAIYSGFVLNTVKGVPFWNSALLPMLVGLYGILCGLGVMMVIALSGSSIDLSLAEGVSRYLIFTTTALIAVYLWAAARRDPTGRHSVLQQLRGELRFVFWGGLVGLGIVVPVAIAIVSFFVGQLSPVLLVVGVASEVTGGLSLGFCVLKAGAYKPLVARPAHSRQPVR